MKEHTKNLLKICTDWLIRCLSLAFFILSIWSICKINYEDSHFIHYKYKGQSYILHINEGWEDIVIDMQYDNILTSRVISRDDARENGLFKVNGGNNPRIYLFLSDRDYEKIIQHMLYETERETNNEGS